eukprot:12897013-Alexandrium_andersonii.AAC.1
MPTHASARPAPPKVGSQRLEGLRRSRGTSRCALSMFRCLLAVLGAPQSMFGTLGHSPKTPKAGSQRPAPLEVASSESGRDCREQF